jgi:hypothetical protein
VKAEDREHGDCAQAVDIGSVRLPRSRRAISHLLCFNA